MNIQQELDSLFENALALLKESIEEPEKQSERGERLCAWNKKFRAVGRAITANPLPRQIPRGRQANSNSGNTARGCIFPSPATF
jgi:hypothetical protein